MVWRLSWRTQGLALIVIAGLGWFGIADLSRAEGDSIVIGLVFVVLALAIAYLTFVRVRLVLGEHDVTVRNPLRTTVIPLVEVTDVNLDHPSRLLEIRYTEAGRELAARTVTLDRRGGLKIMRMDSRSKLAVAQIQQAAAIARGDHSALES